jgi:hypothetical protein
VLFVTRTPNLLFALRHSLTRIPNLLFVLRHSFTRISHLLLKKKKPATFVAGFGYAMDFLLKQLALG